MKHGIVRVTIAKIGIASALSAYFCVSMAAVTISGELKKWHKITITVDGPAASETGTPNPFTDYRFNVVFVNGAEKYTVPGYFAADGNAAESGATAGNIWRVHFSPDTTGTWSYTVSFRSGANIALSDDSSAGTAVSMADGLKGTFAVLATDKSGRDLRGKGLLKYIGGHHLQFAETGEFFLAGGPDAPENFLGYADFDNTPDNGGRRKTWSPHIQDWKTGDPTWQNGKGKGIIGAINYLSSKGMNTFSFIPMNINGDDKNVFPYVSDQAADRTRFDCSKLDQWNILFDHADKIGMHLLFKTQEQENDQLLDGGNVGIERKTYYRELIARFGHHLALTWNLGEETTQTVSQQKEMAAYFYNHDPYKHHIVINTFPGEQDKIYRPLLGSASELTGVTLQTDRNNVNAETKQWIAESRQAGKKWVVVCNEITDMQTAVPPDPGYPGYTGSTPSQHDIRKQVLWGNFMAGGGGVEYYFGYSLPQGDLSCQDFRSRDRMWDYTRRAMEFFQNNLPFQEMTSDDALTSSTGDFCFSKAGVTYVVYLPGGGTTNIDLPIGDFNVRWFDPRNGGSLKSGSTLLVNGGKGCALGNAPDSSTSDWVLLITKTTSAISAQNGNQLSGVSKRSVVIGKDGGILVNQRAIDPFCGLEIYSIDGRLITKMEIPTVMGPVRVPVPLQRGTCIIKLLFGSGTSREMAVRIFR